MCVYVVCMLSNNQGNGIFLQASDRHALLVHSSTSAPPVDFLLTCLLSIMCGLTRETLLPHLVLVSPAADCKREYQASVDGILSRQAQS